MGRVFDKLKISIIWFSWSRSAKSNDRDLQLIKNSAQLAAKCALDHESGLVGLDMDENGELLLIDFNRIKGEKPFDHKEKWFVDILRSIGQIDWTSSINLPDRS